MGTEPDETDPPAPAPAKSSSDAKRALLRQSYAERLFSQYLARPDREIIEELRGARLARGLSYVALARLTGFTALQISEWENLLHSPRVLSLAIIAKALGREVKLVEAGAAATPQTNAQIGEESP